MRRVQEILFPPGLLTTALLVILWAGESRSVEATSASSPSSSSSAPSPPQRRLPHTHRPFRLPGRRYDVSSDEDDGLSWVGAGREFDLFGSPSSSASSSRPQKQQQEPLTSQRTQPDEMDDYDDREHTAAEENLDTEKPFMSSSSLPLYMRVRSASARNTSSSSYTAAAGGFNFPGSSDDDDENGDRYQFRPGTSGPYIRRRRSQGKPSLFQPVTNWWSTNISPNIKSWPKIQCRVEPTTTLKLRKTFRPLKTIVRIGADFNTQLGVWQFHSSWEDAFIGGQLTLAGRELQFSKSWQLSVGAVEDLVTRLRFRAAVDLSTWKAYARVGFRTERLTPINIMEGFTLQKQVPLDGPDGHVRLQVKANFALPEPEIEYSTETQRSLVGMGDIEVNIEELNLLLDY